jgi:threonine dehydrogenase-like Zn-dependent dehydrogenase
MRPVLVRWQLHPQDIITHRFPLEDVTEAYSLMASGKCGKVAVCADEELNGHGNKLQETA